MATAREKETERGGDPSEVCEGHPDRNAVGYSQDGVPLCHTCCIEAKTQRRRETVAAALDGRAPLWEGSDAWMELESLYDEWGYGARQLKEVSDGEG